MNTYIIYYEAKGTRKEQFTKVKANSPEKALNAFYSEFSPRLYEATGYERLCTL